MLNPPKRLRGDGGDPKKQFQHTVGACRALQHGLDRGAIQCTPIKRLNRAKPNYPRLRERYIVKPAQLHSSNQLDHNPYYSILL